MFKNQNLVIILSAFLIVGACRQQNSVVSTDQVATPQASIEASTVIIDVRSPEEYASGHLQKAINVPYDEISNKINVLVPNKEQAVLLYCRSGRRSGIALKTMQEMGYRSVVNAGSYDELKAKGFQ